MNRIKILDCTLRDGGYVNNFMFGKDIIENIITKLSQASIDIIECGFLVSKENDANKSLYGSVSNIKKVIVKKNLNLMYVAMIQFGKITIDEVEECDGTSIDGIRLTFHEHEIDEAFVQAEQLMKKGYKVFMQPVGTTTYTDKALLKLVDRINVLKPFAFYMVDTLGMMYKKDLLKMFYLIDDRLAKDILLGFHSHNNLQLAFSNAQELLQLNTKRDLIIDTSVFGIGRAAGNLNTELITQYINDNIALKYDNIKILEIIDEHIKPIKLQYTWGYDVAYYIAAITRCHPNYAMFLLNKQTLRAKDIYGILSTLDETERGVFNQKYINERYLSFMAHHVEDAEGLKKIKEKIGSKKVLILAPGKSIDIDKEKIQELIESREYFVISVNFMPIEHYNVDMVFVSNMKRFDTLENLQKPIVVTSNITTEGKENLFILDYLSYTNGDNCILDNSGIMCINMLRKIGINELFLAGFDGYSFNIQENYYKTKMLNSVEKEHAQDLNKAIKNKIKQLKSQIKLNFVTKSIYED